MSHFPAWLRSVHWNDPVPHLAPSKMGFHHVGRELWWDEKSGANSGAGAGAAPSVVVCDGGGEDTNCSASIVAALVVSDHFYYLGHKVVQCAPF